MFVTCPTVEVTRTALDIVWASIIGAGDVVWGYGWLDWLGFLSVDLYSSISVCRPLTGELELSMCRRLGDNPTQQSPDMLYMW